MRVFLSWSGSRSKAVAEALKAWMPQIIQAIDPWISVDIDKGRRWDHEIAAQLEESKVGIICLAKDNLESPWVHFEAGALSKMKDAYVCTLLLDLKPAEVEPPLGIFQHTATDRDDIYKLMHTISAVVQREGERSPTDSVFNSLFDKLWPDLQKALAAAAKQPKPTKSPVRPDSEILQEILEIVRAQERRQALEVAQTNAALVVARGVQESRDRVAHQLEAAIKERVRRGDSDSDIIAAVKDFSMPLAWVEDKIQEFKEENANQCLDDAFAFDPLQDKRVGRRIHNLDDLIELWPAVLVRIKKKIGVPALAYLQDAQPMSFDDENLVIEFQKKFHYEKVIDAAKRLPFEQVINECLATPHRLRFQLAQKDKN